MRRSRLALECSLAASLGAPEELLGRHYGERVMNRALGRKYRGATIRSCLDFALEQLGQSCAGKTDGDFIRAAFAANEALSAAGGDGFSTYSLPGILGNAQNKVLLAAYHAVDVTWRLFCGVKSLKNFKPGVRYRLTGQGKYLPVGNSGQLSRVSLDEQSYPIQLGTQGAVLSLTRQDIINDDLGALADGPKLLGRMSALAIERGVYTLLRSNAGDFFSQANRNLLMGAGNDMSFQGLTFAWAAIFNQVDQNNEPILITPRIVLSASWNQMLADQLVRSKEVRGESTIGYGTANPWEGRLTAAATPWLSSAVGDVQGISGAVPNGDLAWYMFSDPASGVSAMDVAFLNGNDAPTITTATADFDTLGIAMVAYHDFAAAFADYRAGALSYPTTLPDGDGDFGDGGSWRGHGRPVMAQWYGAGPATKSDVQAALSTALAADE